MGSLFGSLLGGIFGGMKSARVSKTDSRQASIQSSVEEARRSNLAKDLEDEKKRGRAAAQLALIKTGAGGLQNEATTGRRKLLGN